MAIVEHTNQEAGHRHGASHFFDGDADDQTGNAAVVDNGGRVAAENAREHDGDDDNAVGNGDTADGDDAGGGDDPDGASGERAR